jgi:hypothetical protein
MPHPVDLPTPRSVTAAEWVRAMEPGREAGSSEPHQFRCDDDCLYMVKATNHPQDGRVITNEVVGGLALDWLGVVHPPVAIVDLPAALLAISPRARYNNGQPLAAGMAFGSEFWPSEPQGTVPVEALVNTAELAGICVFDTWIQNHDSRQFRVRASSTHHGSFEFIPLDQGHSFGPNWDANTLTQGSGGTPVATELRALSPTDVAPFIDRLKQFTQQVAEHLVAQVPDSWISQPQRQALVTYLTARAPLAAEALNARYPR